MSGAADEPDGATPLDPDERFHHRLVSIHLFANGNGRHARITADIYITENFDHAPIDWATGHDLLHTNERRDTYIAGLRAAARGAYGPLLEFVGM
ncbi:MAG: Fic family protein [Parvibaculum sp.]|nr:Fic family protein [Parvibaculum sp.]